MKRGNQSDHVWQHKNGLFYRIETDSEPTAEWIAKTSVPGIVIIPPDPAQIWFELTKSQTADAQTRLSGTGLRGGLAGSATGPSAVLCRLRPSGEHEATIDDYEWEFKRSPLPAKPLTFRKCFDCSAATTEMVSAERRWIAAG